MLLPLAFASLQHCLNTVGHSGDDYHSRHANCCNVPKAVRLVPNRKRFLEVKPEESKASRRSNVDQYHEHSGSEHRSKP